MRARLSTFGLASFVLLLSACASSAPHAETRADKQPAGAKNESTEVADDEAVAGEEDAKQNRVPAELAEMLEPRTCNPTLITNTHFRELRDTKGKKHRAFLISPGEELCLVGSEGDDSLADLELAEDPVPLDHAKQRLISVELKTLNMGSVLVVKNHYRATLRFHGSMALPHQLDLVSTSVCPVKPGRFSVEHWPDPVSSLLLTDFSLHDPSEQLGCE